MPFPRLKSPRRRRIVLGNHRRDGGRGARETRLTCEEGRKPVRRWGFPGDGGAQQVVRPGTARGRAAAQLLMRAEGRVDLTLILSALLRERGGLRLALFLVPVAQGLTLVLPSPSFRRPLMMLGALAILLLCLPRRPCVRWGGRLGETGGPVRWSDRLTPQTLLDMLPEETPPRVRAECELIAAAVRHPRFGDRAIDAPALPRIVQVMNAPDPELPILRPTITRYMAHVRRARRLEARFPLRTDREAARFTRWFIETEVPRMTSLRLPAAVLAGPGPRRRWRTGAQRAVDTPEVARIAEDLRMALETGTLDASDWLSGRLGGEPGALRRHALAQALLANLSLEGELAPPWRSPRIAVLADSTARTPPKPAHPVTVIGQWGDETGLSRNTAMTLDALHLAGLATLHRRVGSTDTRFQPGRRLRRRVHLHHCNADRLPQQIAACPDSECSLHVGFLLWELDRVPAAHRLALDLLDEIWVPSRFLQRCYSAVTNTPVVLMHKGIELPAVRRFSLETLGAQPGRFTALTCYDAHSSVERKNPMAAVRAFQRAFPDPSFPAQLIVKSTPLPDGHWGDPRDQTGQIRACAASDPRIVLVGTLLPFDRFLGLIASADCLISPHRAEGFGYLPAYAMRLGTPVIASDWGGPRDFCTERTGFPIPARRVEVPKGHGIFDVDGAGWAEIDEAALAAALRQLAEHPEDASTRISNARELMLRKYSPAAQGLRYRPRLAALGGLDPAEPVPGLVDR
ncbi:MAG: glycosyltransferase [Pseudomonadota bacterium]